jgi:hypothetical protein
MAAEILLTSEAFVKSVTSISDNVAGKYIKPAIREAQEIGLKGILGDALLSKLKALVGAGTIDATENAAYKALLDRSQYYLAYSAIVDVAQKVSYKIGNFGIVKSADENLQNATQDEIAKTQYYYQSKADACCYDLQGWILENRAAFPELNEHHCRRIASNLQSAASCGIFLGGARGKGPYNRRRRA